MLGKSKRWASLPVSAGFGAKIHNLFDFLKEISPLKPGDHLSGIYQTEEECREIVTSFPGLGLKQRESVLYIADSQTSQTVLDYLQESGLDAEGYRALRVAGEMSGVLRGAPGSQQWGVLKSIAESLAGSPEDSPRCGS